MGIKCGLRRGSRSVCVSGLLRCVEEKKECRVGVVGSRVEPRCELEPGDWSLCSREGAGEIGAPRSQDARPVGPCLTVGRWRGDVEGRPSESPRG